MFGDLFSGMFGKKPDMPMDMTQGADALGQAAAGDNGAFGNNSSGPGFMGRLLSQFQNMDPMQKYMLMNRIGNGFSSGMNGVTGAKMPQVGNVYQNMTPAQPNTMFNPYGNMNGPR